MVEQRKSIFTQEVSAKQTLAKLQQHNAKLRKDARTQLIKKNRFINLFTLPSVDHQHAEKEVFDALTAFMHFEFGFTHDVEVAVIPIRTLRQTVANRERAPCFERVL